MRVLDLGAGPSFASFDLAEIVDKSGKVTAIDISAAYVEHGNSQAKSRVYEHVEFLERQAPDL